MDLFRNFKTKKDEEEKSLQYALYVEDVAKQLNSSLERAHLILEGKQEITLEELEVLISSTTPESELLEEVGIQRIFFHPSGKIETFIRKNGEKVIKKFGLENEKRLKEEYGRKARSSRFTPYSTRPVKLYKNQDNTVHYGVFTENDRFTVTRWLSENDKIKTVDDYYFEGAADGLEGKAALAKALLSAETRFNKAK